MNSNFHKEKKMRQYKGSNSVVLFSASPSNKNNVVYNDIYLTNLLGNYICLYKYISIYLSEFKFRDISIHTK